MADITFAEVTTGTLNGTGVFDQLMRSLKAHIQEEWDSDRIKGSDYSTVYLGSIQTAIAQSIAFVLEKDNKSKQAEMAEAQIAAIEQQITEATLKQADNVANVAKQGIILDKQAASTEAQIALYNRQREGFDDNKYQKLLETQLNSWGLMFSSGLLTQKPAIIESDEVSALYNVLKP